MSEQKYLLKKEDRALRQEVKSLLKRVKGLTWKYFDEELRGSPSVSLYAETHDDIRRLMIELEWWIL